jgi:hypothetical protein
MSEELPDGEMPEKPAQVADKQEPKEEEFDKDRAMNTIKKLRDEEKQWSKERKEFEALKAEKAKAEEAKLDEIQKANKRAEEAEQKVQRLERESLQRKAAEAAGLPTAFAERIKGSTLEEMQEDAKSLLEAMPKKTAPKLDANNPGSQAAGETDQEKRVRLGMG